MKYLVGFVAGDNKIDSTIVERDQLTDDIVLDIERKLGIQRGGEVRVFALSPIGLSNSEAIAQAIVVALTRQAPQPLATASPVPL